MCSSDLVGPGGPPICAYFAEQLARQREVPEPTNHVFGVLIRARVDGRPLTDAEIVTQLHFMVMAGVHTTRGLLTHVVERLVRSPALFRKLRDQPGLVPTFVEESLRHDSPVQRTTRRCTHDTEIGGVPLRAGTGRWPRLPGRGGYSKPGTSDKAVARSSSTSTAATASLRASVAPGHTCAPSPNPRWSRGSGRSSRKLSGSS